MEEYSFVQNNYVANKFNRLEPFQWMQENYFYEVKKETKSKSCKLKKKKIQFLIIEIGFFFIDVLLNYYYYYFFKTVKYKQYLE